MKKIVIFGSENVGKSTIYKNIQKVLNSDEKKILTKPVVNYVENVFNINGNFYNFFDTASFNFADKNDDLIQREIKIVNDNLISSCDLVIWIINSQDSFSDYNFSLQSYLEKKKKNYVIIFNKFKNSSSIKREEFLNDYYFQKLLKKGIKSYFISSLRDKIGTKELQHFLREEFGFQIEKNNNINFKENEISEKDKFVNLTIFGPPNSGKSTLLNSLVKETRSVVSPLAGTTKEDVISNWSRKNVDFKLKDTEGIVNEKRNDKEILKDCQIAWVVIDVSSPITKHALQIINLAEKCEKAITIILNKIDLIDNYQLEEKKEEIRSRLKSFSFVPIVCISAKESNNLPSLLKSLDESIEQSKLNFSKSVVANQFEIILKKNPPSSIRGKRLKVYYAIHEGGLVHKFIIFVNNPDLVHFSYQRYIVNSLRRNLKINSLPIKLFFKKS